VVLNIIERRTNMERYEETIMRELKGETPKDKYDYLMKLKKDHDIFKGYIENILGVKDILTTSKENLQVEANVTN